MEGERGLKLRSYVKSSGNANAPPGPYNSFCSNRRALKKCYWSKSACRHTYAACNLTKDAVLPPHLWRTRPPHLF